MRGLTGKAHRTAADAGVLSTPETRKANHERFWAKAQLEQDIVEDEAAKSEVFRVTPPDEVAEYVGADEDVSPVFGELEAPEFKAEVPVFAPPQPADPTVPVSLWDGDPEVGAKVAAEVAEHEAKFDVVTAIVAFEEGEASDDEVIDLFAHLVRTGAAWQLQGAYGRIAANLIENGVISAEGRVGPFRIA